MSDPHGHNRSAFALVGLDEVMALSAGSIAVKVGLLDGPVWTSSPGLEHAHIEVLDGRRDRSDSASSRHGTLIAGILVASADATPPGICPGCTLLVRSIFPPSGSGPAVAEAEDVAVGLTEAMRAGARVIGLSAATGMPTTQRHTYLRHALDTVSRAGVIVVAAVGNQATVGSSELTRHEGVIPVVAYDVQGSPMSLSNLGHSAGLRGLGAPGELLARYAGQDVTVAGTSFAAAVVTGAVALLMSLFPHASACSIRSALRPGRARSVAPPIMDVRDAYRRLASS